MGHFMRRESIVSCWMHWEKYIELTFDSKRGLHCITGKIHVGMPMAMPMPIPRFPNGRPRAIYSCHNFNRFDNLKRWKLNKVLTTYYYTFLNKKCSINQENLWKKNNKKQNTIANTEAELILRIFLIFCPIWAWMFL